MVPPGSGRDHSQRRGTQLVTSILLTDLYELTMLQAYFEQRMNGRAVFELFVRKLPPHRNFLVAAGLAQLLDYLAALRFDEDDLARLNGCGRFTREFVDSPPIFASPAMSMRYRRGPSSSPTSRSCASARRCVKRSWSRAA